MREKIFDRTELDDSMNDLKIVREGFSSVIFGQSQLIERVLITLLTNNHCLIEGVPGLAKTLTVQTLANIFQLEFTRVQFTPDLLPADITGTMMYDPGQGLFNPYFGPVFTNILLADEINRAPAKVHSALLEAMQEQQVSMGGQSYVLPKPFMVLATQNPIEYEATYALPEAQLDRFMLKIVIDYPTQIEGREILDASLFLCDKLNSDSLKFLVGNFRPDLQNIINLPYPAGGIAIIFFNIKSWKNLDEKTGVLDAFIYPNFLKKNEKEN